MRKFMTCVLLGGVCFLLGSVSFLRAEDVEEYKVQRGDTLWDLSESYLKNPLLWPKIWKINPGIANPHRISPGQVVKIPQLGEKPATEMPAEDAGAQLAKPAPPKPTVDLSRPPLALKIVREPKAPAPETVVKKKAAFDMGRFERGIGIVTDDIPAAGKVLHTESGWGGVGAGESILVQAPGAKKGQLFGVYRDMGAVKYRGDFFKASPGHLVADIGIVEVAGGNGRQQRAVVKKAFAEIKEGDLLGPLPYVPDIKAIKNGPANVGGTVVAVYLNRSIAGPDEIVYLDRGAKNGLAPGQRLAVTGEKGAEDRRSTGQIIVLRVTPTTAAAVVTQKSGHQVEPGDKVASM